MTHMAATVPETKIQAQSPFSKTFSRPTVMSPNVSNPNSGACVIERLFGTGQGAGTSSPRAKCRVRPCSPATGSATASREPNANKRSRTRRKSLNFQASSGSGPRSGRGGRRFKSRHSDQYLARSVNLIPNVSPNFSFCFAYCSAFSIKIGSQEDATFPRHTKYRLSRCKSLGDSDTMTQQSPSLGRSASVRI
jgi:hypothetical protein